MADMPTAADLRDIYEYNWRVLRDYCDALSAMPEEAVLKNREATYRSMKNIFHHIVKGHDGWLNVSAQDDSPDPKVYDGDFDALPTMASVREYMEKVIAKEQALLASLKDDDLDRPIQAWWKKRPHPLRDALMQVTFEQAHHTGELIALLATGRRTAGDDVDRRPHGDRGNRWALVTDASRVQDLREVVVDPRERGGVTGPGGELAREPRLEGEQRVHDRVLHVLASGAADDRRRDRFGPADE